MKNLILIAILTLPSLANAQSLMNIYCHECRDLADYPEDARNFSYNQVFGSSSWLTLDQADRFQVTDSFGNTVTIDINAELQISLTAADLFELGTMGQLLVDDLVIQIRVIYQNLDIVEYLFTRKDVPGDLPVGEDNTPSGSSGGGSADPTDEEDDSFNDAADHEYEDLIDAGGEFVCTHCTIQVIYDDDSLSDPYDLWTEEEWEEMQEL